MPDSPSQRIAIYKEWNGLRITIRAARGLIFFFCILWLSFWVLVGSQFIVAFVGKMAHPDTVSNFEILWTIGWFLGVCFVSAKILWGLGGMETMLVTPAELQITSTLFGFTISSSSTPTSTIRNLHFTPGRQRGRSYTPSRISFDCGRDTINFASGIEPPAAATVMNAMVTVPSFPKQEPALADMGTAQARWR